MKYMPDYKVVAYYKTDAKTFSIRYPVENTYASSYNKIIIY